MRSITFKADKISGIEGCLFLASIILEVVKANNLRNLFNFPFYALTLNIETCKADEWIIEKEYQAVCDKIISKVKKDGLEYFENTRKSIIKESEDFRKYTLKTISSLPKFNDQKLVDTYSKAMNKYSYYFGLGAVSFLYEGILSERLAVSMAKHYENVAEILSALMKTDYKSFMMESEEFLERIKNEKNNIKKEKLIKKYIENFYFIKANYLKAPVMNQQAVLKEVKRLKLIKNNSAKCDGRIDLKKVKLDIEEEIIVNILKITETIRDQRKRTNLIGMYCMYRFLDEAIRRKGINRKLADRIFWFEYKNLIYNTKDITPVLRKRKYASIVFDGINSFFLEKTAVKEIKKINKDIKILKGTPAAKGKTKGRARIILGSKDFSKFLKEEVLVAEMTRPDFLPLMKIAKAIITDEGGLTCHAAIVSRELGVPCIVGAKIATQVLKDGDLVEVDADKGVVKILK